MTTPVYGPVYGLVEAGGTKFVLAIAKDKDTIVATTRIATTTPDETLGAMLDWFAAQEKVYGAFTAFGVASFGPLDLDKGSPTWGYITRTTKPHWDHTDLAGPLQARFGCPVAVDTDVNGAALAEYRWGAAQGQKIGIYLTVGTGVGGGVIVDGALLQGLSHPEMGHIRLARHPLDHDFAGVCSFHGDCLEGLACGPSIIARWGDSLSGLAADHIGHDIIAYYLGQAVANLQAIFEPGRIIFGGGVLGAAGMIDRVRTQAALLGKGYFVGNPAEIVTLPALGDNAGILGALALAMDAV